MKSKIDGRKYAILAEWMDKPVRINKKETDDELKKLSRALTNLADVLRAIYIKNEDLYHIVKYSEIESPSILFRDVSKILLPIHWKSSKVMSEGITERKSPPYSPGMNMSYKDGGTSYVVQLQTVTNYKMFLVCINGLTVLHRTLSIFYNN